MDRIESGNPVLCVSKGAAIYSGTIIDTGAHSHHAIQVVFSVRNHFQVRLEGGLFSTNAVIIDSDVEHELLASGIQCVFFYAEPESEFGQKLREKMHGAYEILADHKGLCADIVNFCVHRPSVREFQKIVQRHWLLPEKTTLLDPRINQVLKLIDEVEFKKTKIVDLAEKIGISEGRLQHLFKEQVGIPIRKYLLWKRIIDGINFAVRGHDFSTAAYEAGFADGAHMSRTFKEMFGINLSDFFTAKQTLEVYFENAS